LTGLLAAFQFLTILPVKRDFSAEQLGRSAVYFPLVGIVIGLLLAAINYVFSLIFPSAVVNILLVAALAVLSGGLHLDGLADTLDGIAGHRTAAERLEIMRDSRIGGFGAIGVALFLLIEYVSLNSIPANLKFYVLILAPALSRWVMVNTIFAYPYARPSGLGKAFKEVVNWRHWAIATVVSLILSVVLFKVAGPAILAGTWVIITLAALFLKRQLNGLTGDTYGALNELATIGVFLLVSMLAFKGWLIW
jgi:adenosylcobinamide-GDP ribazoletransferase